jgi:MFS family permease
MVSIAVYYLLSHAVVFFSAIPLANVLRKIGHQKIFIWSYLLRLVALIALYQSSHAAWYIIPAMLIDGIQTNMFWTSYHTVLSQNTVKRHMGQDLGVLQFLLQLVAVISPAISGFIAFTTGLQSLFLIAFVGTIIGLFLTLRMQFNYVFDRVSLAEFRKWLAEPRFKQLTVSIMGRYINDTALFLWPLYVFIFLGSVEKVGYLYTISLFLALLFTFFLGMYIDKARNKKPFLVSGGVLSLLWLLRVQFLSIISITLIDVVDRLTSNFHWLFFDMILMRRGKGKEALSYFVYREMILCVAAFFFWGVFLLFFIFGLGWKSLFIFASLGVMLSVLISDKEETHDV